MYKNLWISKKPDPNIEQLWAFERKTARSGQLRKRRESLPFSPSQKDSGNAAAHSIERISSDRKAAGYFMRLLISILNTPSPQVPKKISKVRHNNFHAAITQARCPVYESHLFVHNFSPQSICLASTSMIP